MPGSQSLRPGRRLPFRPFLLWLGLSLLPAVPARAQVMRLLPEVLALAAPDAGMGSGGRRPLLSSGMSGVAHPIRDPAHVIADGIPILQVGREGGLAYRSWKGPMRDANAAAYATRVSASVPTGSGGWYVMWGGDRTTAPLNARLPDVPASLDRSPTDRRAWFGIRGAGPNWSAVVLAGGSGAEKRSAEMALALRWQLSSRWDLHFWGSRYSGRDRFDLAWQDAAIELPVTLQLQVRGAEAGWNGPGWKAFVRLEDRGVGRIPADRPDHHLVLLPSLTRLEAEAAPPGDRMRLVAGLGWGAHRAELDQNGVRYGALSVDDRREWVRISWRPGGERGRTFLRGGATRTRLWSRGVVEFWPFTPTIVDLLGLRRNMEASGHVSDLQAGASWDRRDSGEIGLRASLDLHLLFTDGRLTSWEPIVLGVGRRNILQEDLPIRSAQLLDLGLEASLPLVDGWMLRGGIAQLVPLAVQRKGGVPSPSGGTGPSSRATGGGLRWFLTLVLPGG